MNRNVALLLEVTNDCISPSFTQCLVTSSFAGSVGKPCYFDNETLLILGLLHDAVEFLFLRIGQHRAADLEVNSFLGFLLISVEVGNPLVCGAYTLVRSVGSLFYLAHLLLGLFSVCF